MVHNHHLLHYSSTNSGHDPGYTAVHRVLPNIDPVTQLLSGLFLCVVKPVKMNKSATKRKITSLTTSSVTLVPIRGLPFSFAPLALQVLNKETALQVLNKETVPHKHQFSITLNSLYFALHPSFTHLLRSQLLNLVNHNLVSPTHWKTCFYICSDKSLKLMDNKCTLTVTKLFGLLLVGTGEREQLQQCHSSFQRQVELQCLVWQFSSSPLGGPAAVGQSPTLLQQYQFVPLSWLHVTAEVSSLTRLTNDAFRIQIQDTSFRLKCLKLRCHDFSALAD